MKRESLKDPARERRQFVWRAGLAGVLVAAAFAGLLGRLIYLQVFEHPRYAALAQENRVRVVALPPPRGLIYDRHGVVLAENVPSYSLEITPEQVPDLDAALTGLAQVVALTPEDLRRFRAQVRAGWPFKSIVLKPNLTPQEVARFAVERYRFPGVDVVPRLRRYYPWGRPWRRWWVMSGASTSPNCARSMPPTMKAPPSSARWA